MKNGLKTLYLFFTSLKIEKKLEMYPPLIKKVILNTICVLRNRYHLQTACLIDEERCQNTQAQIMIKTPQEYKSTGIICVKVIFRYYSKAMENILIY